MAERRLFFRKILLAAVAIIAITLAAMYFSLTRYATQRQGAPVDPAVRAQVLIIALAASSAALLIGFLIARSLTIRVRRLKRIAEGMLGDALDTYRPFDPHDDLGALERSLTAVSKELRTLVDNLRLESARREAILSGMTEGVLATDSDLRIIFCNHAFMSALSYRAKNFSGLPLIEAVRDPALNELVRSVVGKGQAGKLRLQLSAADKPRIFEVHVTPLAMPTGRGALAIFHDTTDLERLEQVRKDFVANVSHEFRTPLAGIIGYADTLLDGALEDANNRRRFVEIIRSNAVRLGSIASDLLVLSELESGVEPQEPETISVRAVVDAAILTVEAEARERNVQVIRDRIDDVSVTGIRLRLEQALLNLLANAVKFNRRGGEVRVRVERNAKGQIEIVVADTGVGIPSEDLPRIFERFYRVDKARSRQVGGTGLGLSIVKHVVERMNGSVSVESQLGKGSVFTLTLPEAVGTHSVRSRSPAS